jgi:hypothetical protein
VRVLSSSPFVRVWLPVAAEPFGSQTTRECIKIISGQYDELDERAMAGVAVDARRSRPDHSGASGFERESAAALGLLVSLRGSETRLAGRVRLQLFILPADGVLVLDVPEPDSRDLGPALNAPEELVEPLDSSAVTAGDNFSCSLVASLVHFCSKSYRMGKRCSIL